MKKLILVPVFLLSLRILAQNEDSLDNERLARMISLSEVVIRANLDVASFIDRVKKDTTFYKAFRSLHLLNFTS